MSEFIARGVRFSDVVKHAHEGIWTIDPAGCTTYINSRMADLLGYTVEEMMGRVHTDFMWPEDRPGGDLQMELRRAGRPDVWDQRYRRKDGTDLWTVASCSALYNDDREFLGALGMFIDITARKTLEQALAQSESRFRGTFENAAVGMAHFATDLRCIRANRTLSQMLGQPIDTAHEIHLRSLIHPQDLPTLLQEIAALLLRTKENFAVESRLRTSDGDYCWVEFSGSLLEQNGTTSDWIAVIKDISGRRAALMQLREKEAELRTASQAKDNFLASLSHELRTPLNPILMIATEAASDSSLPPDAKAMFEIIERSATQQSRLIDDLLDLTRIASGKMSLKLEALDLHRLLEAVFADFQSQFAVRKITLRTHLDAPTSVIPGDKVRLNQVFSNLLSNAIKFTPAGGVVSVATRTDATAQVFFIDIRDTGMGMQPAEIGRLFQRFSQGDHAHQTPGKHSGLGLGLAICHGIVNAHHGSLKAASEGLGHGSTFTVALPITVHPGD